MDSLKIYEGLERVLDPEEFSKQAGPVIASAFERIIADTLAGDVDWVRDMGPKEHYVGEATVLNAKGEEIRIPVIFLTDYGEGTTKSGYLRLESEEGPCRNTGHEAVKNLAVTHFGIKKWGYLS
ncbi:hypothetical protein KKG24_05470 [Patescibacteria group bacterium]|nr:hypothetical protein [Patescibacteria group bacterium]